MDFYWILFFILILGACCGSFLNVVIYRLPLMLYFQWKEHCQNQPLEKDNIDIGEQQTFNLCFPSSHCPHCKTPISIFYNIPLIGYFLAKRRCQHCQQSIHWRYVAIEIIGIIAALMAVMLFGLTLKALAVFIFTCYLVVLSVIDWETFLLPDSLTQTLLWLGLIFNLYGFFTSSENAVIGAIAGYVVLWMVYHIFKIATGKEGMGYGDFKLLAALGAWLGWSALIPIMLIASISGLLLALVIFCFKRKIRSVPIPFGPCLALAGWIVLVGQGYFLIY